MLQCNTPPSLFHHLDTLKKLSRIFEEIRRRKPRMGCVQAKEATFRSSPQRGLEKLKIDNGYVRGENAVIKSTSSKQHSSSKELNKPLSGGVQAKNAAVSAGAGDGRGDGGERKISRESERGVNGVGNVSHRILAQKIVADELINGWPRWLVENVSVDALAGFVPKSADSYEKLAKVGQGTYSNVYKAMDKSNGKIVALKKVRFDTSEPESVKFMAREIIILRQLDHPNIIKLEGIATSRMQYSLYLVFEFMQSDLTKVITRSERKLTEPQVKSYMQQLLAGLQHCHERGILHRDIKGSNLLIDKNGVLKIADFGLANFYQNRTKRALTSRVVTLWYRAPELLLGSTDYEVGIDLWSAGCLLAEMFVGRPIMPGRNEIEQLHKIFKLCGSPPEDYWKRVKPPTSFRPPQPYTSNFKETFPNMSDSALALLNKLLSLDPLSRGTAASALHSEFFTSSPLPSDLSGMPVMSTEDNEPVQSARRTKIFNGKQRFHKGHNRRVSFTGHVHIGEAASTQEETSVVINLQGQDTGGASITSTKPSNCRQELPPHSPTPAFRTQHNRSAKTEAHPNALKNIKNYPLLLASLTEAAHHLEASNSSLYRRSFSNIDFRSLDMEKISKLFGLEEK